MECLGIMMIYGEIWVDPGLGDVEAWGCRAL